MGNVTYKGQSYAVYGDLAAANLYLQVAVGAGPDAWNALDADGKAKFLVQAFRMLEAMVWQGARATPNQIQQWPRTGVVDAYGLSVDSSSVPANVTSAEYELAALLAADATITTQTQSGSNVHRIEAKGVGVQFFRPTNVPGVSPILPVPVMRLVGQYLGSAQAAPLSQSFQSNDADDDGDNVDDDIDSAFSDEAIMSRNGPLI